MTKAGNDVARGTASACAPESASADDAALLARLSVGDDSAYEEIVRTHGFRVLGVARRYLRSEQDAQDCFQETFLKVFQSIDTFEQRSTLGYWIRGVAINQCLMTLRKRRRHAEESIDDLLPTFDEQGRRVARDSKRQSAQFEALHAQGNKQMVRDAIARLPDDYRTVLLLRDIDGYSTRETASILGIRENAVKTRLHRARSALKTMLEPLLSVEELTC